MTGPAAETTWEELRAMLRAECERARLESLLADDRRWDVASGAGSAWPTR
jgi:hypothetical protein